MSTMTGAGAVATGLRNLEAVAHDISVCRNPIHIWSTEADSGLPAVMAKDCFSSVGQGLVVGASTRDNLPSLLQRLLERPIDKVNILASEVKRSKIGR